MLNRNDFFDDIVDMTMDEDNKTHINPEDAVKDLIDEQEIEEPIVDDTEEDDINEELDDIEFSTEEEEGFEELEVEDDDDLFKPEKRTHEEKKEYAFAQLRKENKEHEAKLRELNEVALSYGFSSHEEMVSKLREDAMNKEARSKGVDPDIYREMQTTRAELEAIKRERLEERNQLLANNIIRNINEFSNKHGLDDNDKAELISRLDDDGFSLDDLAKIKNPTRIFKGYMSDTIIERERQKNLTNASKRKSLEEKRMSETKNENKYDMDTLIENMINSRKSKY